VQAITHNIRYLADIHANNSRDLKNTRDELEAVKRWNAGL